MSRTVSSQQELVDNVRHSESSRNYAVTHHPIRVQSRQRGLPNKHVLHVTVVLSSSSLGYGRRKLDFQGDRRSELQAVWVV